MADAPASPPAERAPTLLARLRAAPGTCVLLGACVVVFLLAERTGRTTDVHVLLRFGASERSRVWNGEYWRFFTPMFLHIGWVHLLWNVYGIGSWSLPVERAIGTGRFVLAYFLSGVLATAASLLFHDAVAAGASGAGFGVVGITLAIHYHRLGSLGAFLRDRGVRSILFFVALWIVLGASGTIHMDNYAHLGGFVTGAAIGAIVIKSPQRDRAYRLMAWAMVATVVGFAVAAASRRWPGQTAKVGAEEAMLAAAEADKHGDLARALARNDVALSYDKDEPIVWAQRGELHYALGDPQSAADDFHRALSLAPADWPYRAQVQKLLGQAEEMSTAPEPSSTRNAPSESSNGHVPLPSAFPSSSAR